MGYHAGSLLPLDDNAIVLKAKSDLDAMLGSPCAAASVVDAAVVRLPGGVNWYFPGSYRDMPDVTSDSVPNAFFVGDLVRSDHGSWSQEKAFVTGLEAANAISGKPLTDGVIPLKVDEPHVDAGRVALRTLRRLGGPSFADFLW